MGGESADNDALLDAGHRRLRYRARASRMWSATPGGSMRCTTSVAKGALVGALIAGCSTQQALPPQASAASVAAPGAPIEFRVVADESNPTACKRFDAQLFRGHTFRVTGDTATFTSASGLSSKMTQTSPRVYTTDYFNFGSVTLRAVVNAASSPKSLTVTESRFWNCRWSAAAP